jgi:tetratricopeptide (TPR) repeat protein
MRNRILLVCLPAILFLTSPPARAQGRSGGTPPPGRMSAPVRSGSIRGNVRSEGDNGGIEHARVELTFFDAGQAGLAMTNAQGQFEFNNLRFGSYTLIADQDGFEPVHQIIDLEEMTSPQYVVVYMRRLVSSAPRSDKPAVSAKELALPDKAAKDYNAAIDLLYEKHNPEASLALFARVMAKAPTFYGGYLHSGVAEQRLGRYPEAETSLRKAIELRGARPSFVENTLASLLFEEKKFPEAEKAAREGLVAAPGNWAGNYILAQALIAEHQDTEAEKRLEDALTENPSIAKAYLYLANIHMSRKDGHALLKDLNNFLRLEPNGPFSEKARQMRDQEMAELAKANADTQPPAHPQ